MKTLAIIVNYKAAELCVRAAQSVLNSQSLGPIEVVVVDNSCQPTETERLRQSLPHSVELLLPRKNLGFGNACNLAVVTHASDLILLVNPDARLLPDCLSRLQRCLLDHPGAGAVTPQLFWDDERRFLFPPPYPVALFLMDLFRFRRHLRSLATPLLDQIWRWYSLRAWHATSATRLLNLSGAVVLIRRGTLGHPDQLFDPRFFLYFEDTDLFLRMRRAGHMLLLEPTGHAIHYYDQCARADWLEKRALLMQMRDIFLEKHYSALLRWHRNEKDRMRFPVRQPLATPVTFSRPFSIPIPEDLQRSWLIEWSPCPDFIPSVGSFQSGPRFDFSKKQWNQLAPGVYYGRIGAPRGGKPRIGPFSWQVGKAPSAAPTEAK